MENKILAIDPSGTGTTGIYYWDGTQGQFFQFTNKEWVNHCRFILDLVRELQLDYLVFESSNYVSLRGKDMTCLWKLLGAIEALPYGFVGLHSIAIPVDQVKRLRTKLLKGTQTIVGLEYKKGKGWHYNQKKISVHCLDAYLVYWIWQSKANNQSKSKPIGKSIASSKIKAKDKQKHKEKIIEPELPEDIDDDWPELPEDNITFCPGPEDIDQETDHE